MNQPVRLIAHRGYAERYPENTLLALQAAIDAGADAIELDVQFCQDGTPVVFHDPTLERVTGQPGQLRELTVEDLQRFSAHEPARFGDRFQGTPISTLAEVVDALRDGPPQVLVFVEIKRETLPRHAIPQAVQRVLELCRPLGERTVIISFDDTVVQQTRSLGKSEVGWVLSDWSPAGQDRLETLQPDYVFVDIDLLPPPGTPLWRGPWQWAVYEVNDWRQAQDLAERGLGWIETRAVEAMVKGRQAG